MPLSQGNATRSKLMLLLCFALLLPFAAEAQLSREWAKEVQYEGSDFHSLSETALDPEGNLYLLGGSGPVTEGYQLTLLKLDPEGAVLWQKRERSFPGSPLGAIAVAIRVDGEGNPYVLALTKHPDLPHDVLVIKYAPDGQLLWSVSVDNSNGGLDRADDFIVTADGEVYVSGYSPHRMGNDIFAFKLNAAGELQWQQRIESLVASSAAAMALSADEHLYLTAKGTMPDATTAAPYLIKLNGTTGALVYMRSFQSDTELADIQPQVLAIASDGALYAAGTGSVGIYNLLRVVKLNAEAEVEWSVTDHDKSVYLWNMALDPEGNVVLSAAEYFGTQNFYTVKYSGDGERQWASLYNGPANGEDSPRSMAIDARGHIALTGYSSRSRHNTDLIVLLYDKSGNLVGSETFVAEGGLNSQGVSAVFSRQDKLYVAGQAQKAGGYNFLAIKYNVGACAPGVQANAGEDQEVCLGEEVQLTASGGVRYSWSPAAGLSDPSIPNPVAAPFQTTTYTVTVTDACGNSATDEVVVSVGAKRVTVDMNLSAEAVPVNRLLRANATVAGAALPADLQASWVWGDGSTTPARQIAGSSVLTGEHVYKTPGLYTVGLGFEGECLAPENKDYQQLVAVYDVHAGAVHGTGSFHSPASSLPLMQAAATARFMFTARYPISGAETPIGSTLFMLNNKTRFRSTGYDWLVVREGRAVWHGTGQLNGQGKYAFMVSVGDRGSLLNKDALRVLIWDMAAGGALVYDNHTEGGAITDMTGKLPAVRSGMVIIHHSKRLTHTQVQQTRVAEAAINSAEVYPNPTAGKALLLFTAETSGRYTLSVYDLKGALVSDLGQGTTLVGQPIERQLDFSHLPAGFYVLRLLHNEGVQSLKIKIEK